MRFTLPIKLAIAVLVLFGMVITGMALWRPMKIRHYAGQFEKAKTPAERIKIADILCACGNNGKAVLKEMFRNWAYGSTHQVKIPAGTLTRANGSKVEIKSLWTDKYEVTNEKYYVFAKMTGRRAPWYWKAKIIPQGLEQHPVTWVSQMDAVAYADWLGMRLPTEHEWEYAARAGSTGNYCFGDNESLLDEYAWYMENCGGYNPHPAGEKKPNDWGLYDMYGNVEEWTRSSSENLSSVKTAGGSIRLELKDFHHNYYHSPEGQSYYLGFRCVRDP